MKRFFSLISVFIALAITLASCGPVGVDLPESTEQTTIENTTEAPGTEAPETEAPGTETPGTETPGTETTGTETPGTETPGTETPGTETPRESEGLEFTSNGNGTCYVSGIGTCTDANIIIPAVSPNGDRVTGIGSSAFYDCSDLTSITIPEGVKSIEKYAFFNCRGLIEINFNATAMNDLAYNTYAFSYAGKYADGITVNIGANVTKIPAHLFNPHHSFSSEVPNVTSVVFEKGSECTSIGEYAFNYVKSLVSIAIPESVMIIGSHAFEGCYSLSGITIHDGVISIGSFAFKACSEIKSITIPKSVVNVGTGAFSSCPGLERIEVESGNAEYYSIDNCLIETATKKLIVGCKNSVIPTDGSVTSIADSAFYGAAELTSITIPNSVTYIGPCAFYGCKNLRGVIIPESVTSIGSYAFAGCESITSINIPDNVTNIGDEAFNGCKGLTSVTIGNGVTKINAYTFQRCPALESITIPDSVTSIGNSAFYDCSSLVTVNFGGSQEQWDSISKGKDWDKGIGDYTVTFQAKASDIDD